MAGRTSEDRPPAAPDHFYPIPPDRDRPEARGRHPGRRGRMLEVGRQAEMVGREQVPGLYVDRTVPEDLPGAVRQDAVEAAHPEAVEMIGGAHPRNSPPDSRPASAKRRRLGADGGALKSPTTSMASDGGPAATRSRIRRAATRRARSVRYRWAL